MYRFPWESNAKPGGLVSSRRSSRTSVTPNPCYAAGSRKHADNARAHGDFTDYVVSIVSDVHIAGRIHRDVTAYGQGQLGLRCRPSVSLRSADSWRAGERSDYAIGIDLADNLVVDVVNINVAGGVHRNSGGVVELRTSRGLAVAAESQNARPGDGRDLPARTILRII